MNRIDISEIGDRICEQICNDNDGCKRENNEDCMDCLTKIGQMLIKNNSK